MKNACDTVVAAFFESNQDRHRDAFPSKARSHFPICAQRARMEHEFNPKTVDQQLFELPGFADFLYLYENLKKPWKPKLEATPRRIFFPAYPAVPRCINRFTNLHHVSHHGIHLHQTCATVAALLGTCDLPTSGLCVVVGLCLDEDERLPAFVW